MKPVISGNVIAVDSETTGLRPWVGDKPFAWSMCSEEGETWYCEWEVDPFTRQPIIEEDDLEELKSVLESADVVKPMYNAKFDVRMAEVIGVTVPHDSIEEVQFMVKSVKNDRFNYKLKDVSKEFLDIEDDDQDELHSMTIRARRIAKRLGWPCGGEVEQDYWMPRTIALRHPDEWGADLDKAMNVCEVYAVRDAERTMLMRQLMTHAMRDIDKEHESLRANDPSLPEMRCRGTYDDEMKLWPITYGMESRGVMIRRKALRQLKKKCMRDRRVHRKAVEAAAWPGFDMSSPPQIAGLLYDKLGFQVRRRTKPSKTHPNGQPKTDGQALLEHKDHPAVEALLKWRGADKAINTFFANYEKCAVEEDGLMVVHPSFRQWGTLTGRFSCTDPNMQQVSDPTTSNSKTAEYMVNVRGVFGPRPGYRWYMPDYSQLEVIIFADVAKEPTMLEAIQSGDDIHAATAENIWGGENNPKAISAGMYLLGTDDRRKAVEFMEDHDWRVTEAEKSVDQKRYRKLAKSVTFTKIFGGGAGALMNWIGVEKSEAYSILNEYDDAFPSMRESMRRIMKQGVRYGYVVNPFGRRLAIHPQHTYRAVNYVVQSAAADLMKHGMLNCVEYLRSTSLDAHVVMTIHDELVFEIKKEHAYKKLLNKLCGIMADHGGRFSVSTPVEMDRADEKWSSKQKVDL